METQRRARFVWKHVPLHTADVWRLRFQIAEKILRVLVRAYPSILFDAFAAVLNGSNNPLVARRLTVFQDQLRVPPLRFRVLAHLR